MQKQQDEIWGNSPPTPVNIRNHARENMENNLKINNKNRVTELNPSFKKREGAFSDPELGQEEMKLAGETVTRERGPVLCQGRTSQ